MRLRYPYSPVSASRFDPAQNLSRNLLSLLGCCQVNFIYSRIPLVLRLVNKILILTLLLVMPIQGIAASVSHFLCESPANAEPSTMASNPHHGNSATAQAYDHQNSANSDSINDDYAGHLSCHQVSTGMPIITVLKFANDLHVYLPSSFNSPRLFIPEQPQRPPRA